MHTIKRPDEAQTIRKNLERRGVKVDLRASGLLLDRRLFFNPATNRCAGRNRDAELGRVQCYLLGMQIAARVDLLARLLGK